MPRLEDSIIAEAERLASQGAKMLYASQRLRNSMEGEELGDFAAWVTRLGQLVRKLYGESSEHFATYSKALATNAFYSLHSDWNAHLAILHGLSKCIVDDLERGLLFDIRSLVHAEVFTDFLEMGEHLLQEGYKDAAAVVIGSVLEDTLRQLSLKSKVATVNPSGRPLTIDPLNMALAASNVYSKLVQKQITTWAHVRNKAAHGEYREYTKEQVEMMLLFVQSFCAEHLK
jgi:hypothetical protein